MSLRDINTEKLENLDRLLIESEKTMDLEQHIEDSINFHRRLNLIDGLEAEMKQLEESATRVARLKHVSPQNLLINSQYIEWFRGGKTRHRYIFTVLSDSIIHQGVTAYGPMILIWHDNPQMRLTYIEEFRRRYQELNKRLVMGDLDDLIGKTPQEVLHMINGAHGELVKRLGLESSHTVDRMLEHVRPRLVIVRLNDNKGRGINGATVEYHQDGWKQLHGTTGSQFHDGTLIGLIERETETLRVKVTLRGNQHILKQNQRVNPTFVFQTKRVQVHICSSEMKPIQDAEIRIQADDKIIAESYSNEAGCAEFELFPGKYGININLQGVQTMEDHEVETDKRIVFQTGHVWSNTNTCTRVRAQEWIPFKQGMELFPGSYWFSYGDGASTKPEIIEAGKLTIIH